jgi:hypothetical protein
MSAFGLSADGEGEIVSVSRAGGWGEPEGDPLGALKTLGDLSGPGSAARPWPARAAVNTHVHLPPNFCAFASIAEAVELAASQGVRVLGASNYYDFDAYGPFAALCALSSVFPLFGLEVVCLLDDLRVAGVRVNDPANPGKMYLCGKGITRFAPMGASAAELMGVVRRSDSNRMVAIISKLNALFSENGVATAVSEQSLKSSVAERYGAATAAVHLQERHVAQAFAEALYSAPIAAGDGVPGPGALLSQVHLDHGADMSPARVQDAVRAGFMKVGKPAYVEEAFVGFGHAYRLVLALGGIPCYPVLADGTSPVCELEAPVGSLVAWLERRRVYCAEVIPNRNSPEVLSAYVGALRSAGAIVLAGTEHNTPDMVPMEPTCAGGAPVPEALKDIFWEGACVVAAHQYLMANGRLGYVDELGDLAPNYATNEARIQSFASLGASVIGEYLRSSGLDDLRARADRAPDRGTP